MINPINTIKIKTTIFSLLFLFAFEAHAQPTLSAVFTPNNIGSGSNSRLTFTITNTSASPVTGMSFTDTLPTAISISSAPNIKTTCGFDVGGAITAPNGSGIVTLTDANIAGSQTCTIQVNVTAVTLGMHTNSAVTLSSSAGSSMSLPVDLTVVTTLPSFNKSFAPSTVALGSKSTLTFNMDNTSNALPIGGLQFTDNLPVGLVIASPSNANTNCISALAPNTTLTAIPGSNQIILAAFGQTFIAGLEVLPASATCIVSVDVLATGSGNLVNQTSQLLADNFNAGIAVDELNVTATELSITKEFVDDPIPPGGTVVLSFGLSNRNRNFDASGVTFNDDLSTVLTGLTFDSLISNDCGGTVSGVGTTSIALSSGSIAAQGSCQIDVSLSIPIAATAGVYTNTTSAISATINASLFTGNVATDDLFVEPITVITKTFLNNPVIPGDSTTLEFTLTNTSTTSSATDIAFDDDFDSILATASVTPGGGCCGVGSICTYTPLINPPGGTETPAQLSISSGMLAPAGMAGDSCTFSITLDVLNQAPAGEYLNQTGVVSSIVDGATRIGNSARDTLTVIAAPSLSKSFSDDPVAPGGTVTLEFTLNHSENATTDATNITFTDDLTGVLAGLTAVGLPLTNVCGMGSQISGTTNLSFTGGTLSPGASCTFSVTLNVPITATPSNYTNTTSAVSADVMGQAATAAAASDVLKVAGARFTKEFLGGPVIAGDNVTLRFTIENIHPTADATITFFADDLNSTLSGLAATGAATVDTCGGTLSGTTALTYTGGSILSGATCTIEVNVLVPATAPDGDYLNATSALSIDQGGAATIDLAVDTLQVRSNLLQLTKQFIDDPVAAGSTVILEFALTNLNATQAASAISFTDDLGTAISGLTFDSVVSNNCSATVTGTTTSMINVSNISLPAAGSCLIQVSLTVPVATASAIYTNTTSQVTGIIAGFTVFGDAASDELEVIELLVFSMAFDAPTMATGSAILTFTITNPGANTVDGISFTDDLNAVIPGLIATSLPAAPCGIASNISGISLLAFTGGSLPALGGSCSFSVDVLVPVSATVGSFPNITSDLSVFGLKYSDPAITSLIIESAPTYTKNFTPNVVGLGQTSVLTFIIDNAANPVNAISLDFTDNFPANLIIATPNNVSNTCTGGTLTTIAGTAVVSYTGGSVNSVSSCVISVDVTSTTAGNYVNITGDLTSNLGNSGSANDSLLVVNLPLLSKSFANNPVLINTANQLSIVIDNTNNAFDVTGLAFTDNLPAGMEVANPVNISNTCTDGTLIAVAGNAVIDYANGTVLASSSCIISVDVIATAIGDYVNTTTALQTDLGTSGTATANLTAVEVPVLTKSFVSASINSGNDVELVFDIVNNNTIAANGINFTDDLDAFITGAVASNLPQNDVCGIGSTLTGTNVISLSNGTLAANSSCQFSVMVTVPLNTLSDSFMNVTSPLSVDLGGLAVTGTAGSEASADLMVIGLAIVIPLLNNWLILMLLLMSVLLISKRFIKLKALD